MATKILFHSYGAGKHCPDGFAAALCAYLLGAKAETEYIPCVYDQAPPTIGVGDDVYILDFSFSREVLREMESRARVISVLDHHKSAQESLADLEFAQFDMTRSGAQMAWDAFTGYASPRPALIDYVADRDLWTKQLPYTEEVHRALSSFPQDFEVWNTLLKLPNYVDFMRRIGEPLLAKHQSEVEELAATATWGSFGDGQHRAIRIATNHYSLVSDALNLLCKRHPETPFAYNVWPREEGGLKCELRSVGEFDVSALAKKYGGGGHKNAAGCVI